MSEVKTEIEINASPERVWDILTKLESYPDWNPFIPRAAGNAGVGEKVKIRIKPPGLIGINLNTVVKTAVPHKALSWTYKVGLSFLFHGEHMFELQETERGCHFVDREQFGGLLSGPILLLVRKKTRRGFSDMDEALKQRAESTG